MESEPDTPTEDETHLDCTLLKCEHVSKEQQAQNIFTGFKTYSDLIVGDQRKTHTFAIHRSAENLMDNEMTLSIECGTTIVASTILNRNTTFGIIEAWTNEMLENHKKECNGT
jgi:hypothetical protein